MVPSLDITQKIKRIREIKGLSQEYMAIEFNLSQSQYQRLEARASDLQWSKITQICDILGVTCSHLLGFDDKYVIENCTNSGVGSHFTVNNLPEQLMAQYEA